jgi:arylsulfatase A-like enzyme
VRALAKGTSAGPLAALVALATLGSSFLPACNASRAAAQQVEAPATNGAPPSPRPARPNLILVVVDTLRRDHLGCYGYGKPTSPKLDALAKQSILFQNVTAASSWTEPSTASLLSGLYPARHGAHEYAKVPDSVEMLAETLKAAGYRTGAVSGNPNASPLFGFDQGFDSFFFPGNDVAREYPDVSELVAKAEEFLAKGDGAKSSSASAAATPSPTPFFLYLHVMNVHGPYKAPPQFRERFLEEPHADFPFQNDLWIDLLRHGNVERRKEVGASQLHDLTARYDGAIAYTDQVLGEFLERRLAKGGAASDLVVVTADHGEELFDHGGFGHGFTLHHELLDVPLLVRRPDAADAGKRIDAPVSLVDLPATLLDLLALLPKERGGRVGDGLSLVPLIRGEPLERDAPIVAQLARGKQGAAFLVQHWPLRVVETERDYAGRADVLELFDESKDPKEERDLAAADPSLADRLRTALHARRETLERQGLAAEKPPLDEKTRAALRALGY